jgi:hypothetical protein
MKRFAIVSVLAFLLFVAMRANDAVPLGVQISIAPSGHDEYQLLRRATPDTYTCRAFIYDATNERYGFADPQVIVAAGERQTTTESRDGLEVTFTVAVSKENDRAAAEVVAKRGDKIVLRQKSDVVLRGPGRTIVPLR